MAAKMPWNELVRIEVAAARARGQATTVFRKFHEPGERVGIERCSRCRRPDSTQYVSYLTSVAARVAVCSPLCQGGRYRVPIAQPGNG